MTFLKLYVFKLIFEWIITTKEKKKKKKSLLQINRQINIIRKPTF